MCFTVQMVVTNKWDPTPQITFMDVFDPLISLLYSTTIQCIERNMRDQVIFQGCWRVVVDDFGGAT